MKGSCGVRHSGATPAEIAVSECYSPLSNNLKAPPTPEEYWSSAALSCGYKLTAVQDIGTGNGLFGQFFQAHGYTRRFTIVL